MTLQTGFHVLIVIATNNVTNRKIYRLLTRKTDEGLEHDPIMKHPYDPDGQLILRYHPYITSEKGLGSGLVGSARLQSFSRFSKR